MIVLLDTIQQYVRFIFKWTRKKDSENYQIMLHE
jgi:hypothetical protein